MAAKATKTKAAGFSAPAVESDERHREDVDRFVTRNREELNASIQRARAEVEAGVHSARTIDDIILDGRKRHGGA
jgi:hypothetical protein